MQHRQPSTTSSLTLIKNSSTIRRRSSSHHPKSRHVHHPQLPSIAAEQHNLEPKSTILLREARPSIPSPPLPALPIFEARLEDNAKVTRVTLHDPPRHPDPNHDEAQNIFTPIPLTPRPGDAPLHARAPSMVSQISRLPTPPFSGPPTPNDPTAGPSSSSRPFFPFLPKGLSFLSFRGEAVSVPFWSSLARPPTVRSESGSSVGSGTSAQSYCSKTSFRSVDSGHRSLIPSIGTTTKFTHKWPKPQSLSAGGLGLGNVLEDGEGLGMDRVERWTSFKWCLLISMTTVFAYGAAGLVCAIVTWFRGESFSTRNRASVLTMSSRQLGSMRMSCLWRTTTF
jgi:hypothetical protein